VFLGSINNILVLPEFHSQKYSGSATTGDMHEGGDFTIYGYYSILNFLSICSPAVYGTSNKEFLHLMYIAVRTRSEGLASYELMKWLGVKVEDSLGIHSENESETHEKMVAKQQKNFKDTYVKETGEECHFYVVIITVATATAVVIGIIIIIIIITTTTTTTTQGIWER